MYMTFGLRLENVSGSTVNKPFESGYRTFAISDGDRNIFTSVIIYEIFTDEMSTSLTFTFGLNQSQM